MMTSHFFVPSHFQGGIEIPLWVSPFFSFFYSKQVHNKRTKEKVSGWE